ncbi:hypothetical protein H0H87_008610 [Tephrocybe sp. NHM501043]|nr:hypothetical protein H0H87_008610 [Tephrocybe sp. NHM501043]
MVLRESFVLSMQRQCLTDVYSALVAATDASGKSIFSGKKFTGFSNTEEEINGTVEVSVCHGLDLVDSRRCTVQDIPFLLEDRIKELGGHFEKAAEPWASHVVVDGNLITGQNPASAQSIGEVLKQALCQTKV